MWPCMKLRHLQERLESVQSFDEPKILLEQYVTPPHIASHMLYTIQSQYGDIKGKSVADLGCGTGVLTIGAAVLDAGIVIGFEIDSDALEIFSENIEDHELFNVNCIQCDIRKMDCGFNKKFDTVILNPPFGTKWNAGIDMQFLKTALNLSSNVVYSLHKTSTRSYVLKAAETFGVKGEVLAELCYNLPNSYKFHKKNSVDVNVDFFKFTIK